MRKIVRVLFVFTLICGLVMSAPYQVKATENEERSVQLPDLEGGSEPVTLFTLSCNSLQTEKRSSDYFRTNNLSESVKTIGVRGTITHSVGSTLNAYTMRAGIGYFVSGGNYIHPVLYETFSGASGTIYITRDISYFGSATSYYAFISNMARDYGTVTGNVTVFTLDN